jgi:hypothetical protein
MGLNDEYSRDAYIYEQVWDSDDGDEYDPDLSPEDWQDLHSQELLDGWMKIRDHLDQNYIRTTARFPEFVDLVVYPAKWHTFQAPNELQTILWNLVSRDNPIITDRVQPANFFAWTRNYITQ